MATSVSGIQQQLSGLNASNDEYRPLLLELLCHRDLKPHIQALQGDGLQAFVDLLDGALDHIPPTDNLFRKTLHRLRSTCGNREVLPVSCRISNDTILDRGEQLAAGGFANVHQARLDGRKVCIKVLRTYSQDSNGVATKTFHREVVVWKRLQHPNVVPFLGVPARTPPLEIICDWMENEKITEYIKHYPQVDRIGLLWDVADGLYYLHSHEVIHGDLKGPNILIDEGGRARLAGFGLASIIRGETSLVSPQDPEMEFATTWAAPEILEGGAASKEGDVFTFSMVAVETFTGRPPFITIQTGLYEIMNGNRPQRPGGLSHDGLWALVQRCWDQDPVKRPTGFELVGFFQESFPGRREPAKGQALPTAPSTWTLAGPNVRSDRKIKAHPEPFKKDTLDADEPGPQDPSSTGGPSITGQEPQPLVNRRQAQIENQAEANGSTVDPVAQKGNAPPQTQSTPSSSRRPTGKIKKILGKLFCFC